LVMCDEFCRAQRCERGSLLHCLDACQTGAGSRLLDARLRAPLRTASVINSRLDAVDWMKRNRDVMEVARQLLQRCSDLERAMQRVELRRGMALCVVAQSVPKRDRFPAFSIPTRSCMHS
jgi:DNA mismatch repair ATPase MutS